MTLLLAVAADASAQTPPARQTKAASGSTRRTAAETPTRTRAAAISTISKNPAKGQTQSIYAAPGQPIMVPDGKVGPYDGPAVRRKTTKGGTTLSPR